jgi:hypothetical protein
MKGEARMALEISTFESNVNFKTLTVKQLSDHFVFSSLLNH